MARAHAVIVERRCAAARLGPKRVKLGYYAAGARSLIPRADRTTLAQVFG